MSGDWRELDQLKEQMQYWTDVHEYLIAHTQTGKPEEPGYGLPYLDGNRLVIPDHPRGGCKSSDAWKWRSIVSDRGLYTLVSNGFDRASIFVDSTDFTATRFDFVAKYFLFRLGGSVRRASSLKDNLEVLNWQFLDRGVADGWERVPDSRSSWNAIFRHVNDPLGSRFITRASEAEPTFYLDMSWDAISRMCAEGIPGIDHIPIPGDPGSGK